MNLFTWMFIAHLVGDYLSQTEYEALNKAKGRWLNPALMMHCLKYTLCFVPVIVGYHLNWWWLAVIFITHVVLDGRGFVIWWRTHVNRDPPHSIQQNFWLTIVHDQVWHLIILATIAQLAG